MTMTDFAEYVRDIRKNLERGDATEHTHRPALKSLLEAIGKDIVATNEPRRIACGAPDFNITRKGVPLGHVETKDVGANLDEMERGKGPNGDQFIRYRDGLSNWILTDYLEFRWFVNGEKRQALRVAYLDAKGKVKLLPDGEENLAELLNSFFEQEALTVGTAKELAGRMAGMTRIIRDLIRDTFDKKQDTGWLHNWLQAFRSVLIPDLKPFLTDEERQEKERPPSLDDMFAQTLAYGLFAARVHTPPNMEFSREMAAYNLPKTNPFLRKLFAEIAGVDMPDSIAWAVNDIVELLKHANMSEILKDFGKGKRKGKEDPVVHFYETFLAAYDPKMRKVRGVYYTPEPVVSYIVRSIDHILKSRFNRSKGLADENTMILDPATGTATFLYFIIDQIHREFAKQAGAWDDYVAKHLLNRIFGFELLMAPYSVAHLKIGMQLQETGYKFGSDQRLGIFLTNTLEEAAKKSEQLFANWISDEANAAAGIKSRRPIMVVTGNPPYSSSMCESAWIMGKIAEFKRGLNEQKADLNREEWKFLRFAQWRLEQTGHGILAFIINNTFLDAITHRKMRECLCNAFNNLYILNLHGSSKKKEVSPDGNKDENVFDIQQGVAIAIFIKQPDQKGYCIQYADVWGLRENKYRVLLETDISSTNWIELQPSSPEFLFVPTDKSLEKEYNAGYRLCDFSQGISGIETKRDHFAMDFDRSVLEERIGDFINGNYTETERKEKFNLRDNEWVVEEAVKILRNNNSWREQLVPCLYRAFDSRWVVYNGTIISRDRGPLMAGMVKPNLGLVAARQSKEPFAVLATNRICAHKIVTVYDRSFVFPLYLYASAHSEMILGASGCPNLSPAFLTELAEKLSLSQTKPHGLPKDITPEDIFYYAYAVFHSPTYRTRYAEFLKRDFPRLPLTGNLKLFRSLAAKGAELTELHLMESPNLENFITDWPVKGDNIVEKVLYTDKDKRVWINKTQYFGGVPEAVWNFHVGGYQVCAKWLKDRKGRKLTYEDAQHYQKIVVALSETIGLMQDIDEVIEQHGGWPAAFR